jgi:hypothetical protein
MGTAIAAVSFMAFILWSFLEAVGNYKDGWLASPFE